MLPKDIQKYFSIHLGPQSSLNKSDILNTMTDVVERVISGTFDTKKNSKSTDLYDNLMLMTINYYSSRCTTDEILNDMKEIGILDIYITEYISLYDRFMKYMDSVDSICNKNILGASYRLVDYEWKMKNTVYDSNIKVHNSNMVEGELIYMDIYTDRIYRYVCMISIDNIEQISRQCDECISSCRSLIN